MPSRSKHDPLWENVIQFVQRHLQPPLPQYDSEIFPYKLWKRCGEFGLLGLPVPVEYGGKGYGLEETARVMEAVGYACHDNGLLAAINAHAWSGVLPLWKLGSTEQKQKLLPLLCSGQWIAAHGATEPDAGSDIFSLKTTAERKGDYYILNGTKIYILNAPVADLLIVFANIDPQLRQRGITAFMIKKNTPGITVTRTINKAGLHTALMGEVVLNQCRVPVENRLGAEGIGSTLFNLSMLWERTFILAPHVGTMQRVLEQCIAYAQKRQQYGQQIGKFQAVAHRIADMKVRVEAARLLLYQAVSTLQTGKRDLLDASIAKLFISEAAISIYLDAIRIHGAAGYTRELEFAQDLQDGVATVIFSGTSDIQRQIIARCLGL